MRVSDIKELAERYSVDEIESCIDDQISSGENVCALGAPHKEMVSDLARAQAVRELIEEGLSLSDALRVIARRIREMGRGGGP